MSDLPTDEARRALADELSGAIDCTMKCAIPAGVRLTRVPKPRHAWADVLVCPICDSAFLKLPAHRTLDQNRGGEE